MLDRRMELRGCVRRRAVPNIVHKSVELDQNIERSADYAQKNDNSDHMSHPGKMVILWAGPCRLSGLKARAALARL
jgi:hypothetical protein